MNELSGTVLALIFIVFFAAFQQTISGFGFSLVVMPLATILLGLRVSAPLIAMAGVTLYTINLLRYRNSINLHETMRLGAAAALGVPIGIWLLVNLSESVIKMALGFLLLAYVCASFFLPTMSRIVSPHWVYLAGFVTGCLGGAYNTPGPPLIVYGSLRQWPRAEFRAVLQALFLLTGTLAIFSHWLTQHLTAEVWTFYAYATPALVGGIVIGSLADRFIDHRAFRIIVMMMIAISGLSLILGGR